LAAGLPKIMERSNNSNLWASTRPAKSLQRF